MTWFSNLRYSEKIPGWMLGPIYTIDKWYYEIRNRFFAKYYRIDIRKMPKGAWWDTDHRMFEVIWQLFEDFVEIELFNLAFVCCEDDDPFKVAYRDKNNSLHNTFSFDKDNSADRCHKTSWRRHFIMQHWEWETSLTNAKCDKWYDGNEPDKLTPQAEKAIKIRELYLWWKDVRPNRPDPWEDLHFEPMTFEPAENGLFKMKTGFRHNWTKEQLDAARKIEEDYEEEDTKKTQELIAIRGGLWT